MKILSTLLLFMSATACQAQTETSATLSFEAPQGWTRTADSRTATIALRPPDLRAGSVCVLTVFQPQPFAGSAVEFHQEIVRRAATNARQLELPQNSSVGQFLVTTLHQMLPNGLQLWHRVYTARWSDRGQAFVLSANQPELVQRFVAVADSMIERVVVPAVSPASAASSTSASAEPSLSPAVSMPTPVTSPAAPVGTLDGVYVTLKNKIGATVTGFDYGVYKDYMVFFPDHSVLWRLPDEGLLNFDVARSQREWHDFWGRYEMRGDAVNVVFATGPSYTGRRTAEGKLALGSYTYVRQTSGADGRPLTGTYRPYTLGADPKWDVTFYPDGRFVDKGIRNFVGVMQSDPARVVSASPGTGRYHVGHYSIVFEYTDGRHEQLSFYVPDDNGGSSPELLVIHTMSVVRVH